jgi:hypothetical protein
MNSRVLEEPDQLVAASVEPRKPQSSRAEPLGKTINYWFVESIKPWKMESQLSSKLIYIVRLA